MRGLDLYVLQAAAENLYNYLGELESADEVDKAKVATLMEEIQYAYLGLGVVQSQ